MGGLDMIGASDDAVQLETVELETVEPDDAGPSGPVTGTLTALLHELRAREECSAGAGPSHLADGLWPTLQGSAVPPPGRRDAERAIERLMLVGRGVLLKRRPQRLTGLGRHLPSASSHVVDSSWSSPPA